MLLVLALALTGFDKQPIPPFPGDGNPDHDGQPLFCQNYSDKTVDANCHCKAMNPEQCEEQQDSEGEGDVSESSKCKVYCRHSACKCQSGCTT